MPLLSTAAASAADARIHKNFLGSGGSYDPKAIDLGTTTVIISNKEMEDIGNRCYSNNRKSKKITKE